jgi:uncharacterized heparinase superfamily protein
LHHNRRYVSCPVLTEQDLKEMARKQEEDADAAPLTFNHSKVRDRQIVAAGWECGAPADRPVTVRYKEAVAE